MACMRAYRQMLAAGLAAIICVLVPSLAGAADDPRDATFLAPLLQRALETARTEVETSWRNPATGNGGSIVVERTFYREPGTPCRAYVRTLQAAGAAPQVIRGTGCRSSMGLWLLEEEPEGSTAATTPDRPVGTGGSPRRGVPPEGLAVGPSCPDTVLVPMPAVRPPAFAYTLPSRAEL